MEEIEVRESELAWEPAAGYPAETMWKILHRDLEHKPLSALLKLPAGFQFPGHSHVYAEHHYVLEGTYESMGKSYPAGSYRMIPAHMEHGPFRSDTGAVILVLWQPDA